MRQVLTLVAINNLLVRSPTDTYDEEDVITSNDLTIELIPIWKWLLASEM